MASKLPAATELGWSRPLRARRVWGRKIVWAIGPSHLIIRTPGGEVRSRCGAKAALEPLYRHPPVKWASDVCQRCARPYPKHARAGTLRPPVKERKEKTT